MRLNTILRQFVRISGFRLALRSLALSLGGACLVFVIIHHAAESTWRGQIDSNVSGALTDLLGDLQTNHRGLAWNVRTTMAEGNGLFYAALAPDGAWEAGNFRLTAPAAARWKGMETLRPRDGLSLPSRVDAVRGTAMRFPNGEVLFIAADATALRSLDQLISRSFLAVFGTIMALGLLGSYLAAHAVQRRVDAFATTIRNIMDGDLSRRIGLSGSGDEFDRLATGMNAMLQRIQELMENLRQVTNDISHDLRSPLARLREHLELSRARFSEPALTDMFEEALAQTDQALGIFAAMLRIAEVEAGARRAGFGMVALSPLLAMLAESYEPSFDANGITVEADIAPGLALPGDKELLAQLFTNLLDNIMLHAENVSRVSIHASQAGELIEVSIADNGCGIAAGQKARVMQRFARLEASRHRPGYGLGLPLASAIAALHGGRIRLEDNGPGLRVCIRLRTSLSAMRLGEDHSTA
ncbi:sensor histidine kinase [Acidocella aromatica]|uniref:histidine kinase n=1 Tax=Acidocella aromatica TaxID=1303579 RepID=A0A840VBK1_9PROT|nr:HAMP domain-containing sensor histidine kinase [Acidocella aromatica]MBB5373086.1 signal transduction histidine kinase [Acidocella aromatica]